MKPRVLKPGRRLAGACAISLVVLAGCDGAPDGQAMAQGIAGDLAGGLDPSRPPLEATDVSVQRLWTGSYRTFFLSSISSDGRYLSMVDWSTIDLAARDLGTGELHRLTDVEQLPGMPYEDAGASIFSPDGRKLLYAWQVAPDVQLRTVDFSTDERGSPQHVEPSIVFHNPEFEPYFPLDWSPDGRRVLVKEWLGGEESHTHAVTYLSFVSVPDGEHQVLRSFDWREPLRAAFSPDGAWVAYDLPPEVDSPERDVYVVAVDGSREARVVEGPSIDRLLDWHPNGSLLFHSDRGGNPGVWSLPMADGRPAGQPELLKGEMWSVEPLGSGPGRFYYGTEVSPMRLYSAVLDETSGRLATTPVPLVDPTRLRVQGWAWSPDGNYLAYSATAPGASSAGVAGGGSYIGIVSADGTSVRNLRVALAPTARIRWDGSGESVIAHTTDARARNGFYRIDLETGSVTALLQDHEVEREIQIGLVTGHFAVSPEGDRLYFAVIDPALGPDGWMRLVSRDLVRGEERDLAVVNWPGRVVLSPDGARLAAHMRRPDGGGPAFGTIPAEGGEPTFWTVPEATDPPVDFGWGSDGASILFFTSRQGTGSAEEVALWNLRPDDRVPTRIQLPGHVDPGMLRVHTGTKRIAFRAGEARGEVWMMDWGASTASGDPR
jgi:WD40 repeat protein